MEKEEAKFLLFADDILYVENPKYATRKLLELTMSLVKLWNTKLIQRNLFHFYTLTMKDKKEKLGEQVHLQSYQKE